MPANNPSPNTITFQEAQTLVENWAQYRTDNTNVINLWQPGARFLIGIDFDTEKYASAVTHAYFGITHAEPHTEQQFYLILVSEANDSSTVQDPFIYAAPYSTNLAGTVKYPIHSGKAQQYIADFDHNYQNWIQTVNTYTPGTFLVEEGLTLVSDVPMDGFNDFIEKAPVGADVYMGLRPLSDVSDEPLRLALIFTDPGDIAINWLQFVEDMTTPRPPFFSPASLAAYGILN